MGMPSSQLERVLPNSQQSESSLQTFCATNFLWSPWVFCPHSSSESPAVASHHQTPIMRVLKALDPPPRKSDKKMLQHRWSHMCLYGALALLFFIVSSLLFQQSPNKYSYKHLFSIVGLCKFFASPNLHLCTYSFTRAVIDISPGS